MSFETFVNAQRAPPTTMVMLTEERERGEHGSDRVSREVRSGHYVRVAPEALREPRCVIASASCARMMGFDYDRSDKVFVKYFSGDVAGVANVETWCTPYALSIGGSRMTSNCPFGTGNGYGDGRAITVGEFVNARTGARYEAQLKGGGRTPFCRGADGRAVLRSSIREFLASEAMDALGVSTTRALCLIESAKGTTARRPWYSERSDEEYAKRVPTIDDPRLAGYSPEERADIVATLKAQKRDPDVMIEEPCAITTRVARSFIRVGHIDLFARRATAPRATAEQKKELADIVRFAAFREFPETIDEHGDDLAKVTRAMLHKSGTSIAKMIGGWIRVGFSQGNFNGDNCLVAGRTMDYGPFGFMDNYDPAFAKWTGSGDHFAFMAQPTAGIKNFAVLAISCAPLLKGGEKEANEIINSMRDVFEFELNDVFRVKLGFASTDDSDVASDLFRGESDGLERLMYEDKADWTVTWRRLAECLEVAASSDDDALLKPLLSTSFYGCGLVSGERRKMWADFIRRWRAALETSGTSLADAATRMRAANPKYVLREHLLVDAYTKASKGDHSMVHELYALTQNPYGGGDDTVEFEAKYFVKAPEQSLTAGGVAFMS